MKTKPISNILKGKDINNILLDLNYQHLEDEFIQIIIFLVKKGYFPKIEKYVADDYKENKYYYKNIPIIWGQGATFELKQTKRLDNIDYFFLDHSTISYPDIDSSFSICGLKDNTYNLDVNIRLHGMWKFINREKEMANVFNGDIHVINKNQLITFTDKLIKSAELFVKRKIDKMIEYSDNW